MGSTYLEEDSGGLYGSTRVPDTRHLITAGTAPIPWEWLNRGEQKVSCARKDCEGYYVRQIDPATLSATAPRYVGPGCADEAGTQAPCPDISGGPRKAGGAP